MSTGTAEVEDLLSVNSFGSRCGWNTYNGSERPITTFSLSERVERATILLPIIAQGNVDLQAALDSVAFTESEQRSRAAKFTTLNGFKVNTFDLFYPGSHTVVRFSEDTSSQLLFQRVFNIGKQLPDMTVRDLVEWLDRFSNIEGPIRLADSGQFGLDFVLNEADTLFWTIVPIVRIIQTTDTIASTSRLMLRQVLSNERVRWAFDNLLEQLKALADLACTDEDVQPVL